MKKTYFLVTIFLVLAIGSFEVKTTPLENQWQRGSGSTYYLKGFLPMKHNEAQDWCVLMGGILAEPRSSEETSVIDEIIGEEEKTYWIGLQEVQKDVYRWPSDNAGIEDYSDWCSNRPDGGDETCVVKDRYKGKCWDDYSCSQIAYNYPFYALCQKTI